MPSHYGCSSANAWAKLSAAYLQDAMSFLVYEVVPSGKKWKAMSRLCRMAYLKALFDNDVSRRRDTSATKQLSNLFVDILSSSSKPTDSASAHIDFLLPAAPLCIVPPDLAVWGISVFLRASRVLGIVPFHSYVRMAWLQAVALAGSFASTEWASWSLLPDSVVWCSCERVLLTQWALVA